MATILTKRSNTASSVPLAADLTNSTSGAELAVNTADKRLFTKDSGGTVVELGTNPSSLTLTGGTANGVPYLNGSKVLTTGSALQFDGSNLGLGVTPSAWLTYTSLQIKNSALSAIDNNQVVLSQNGVYTTGSVWKYINSNFATLYQHASGQHIWFTAPSGTAGNAISFTQAMTLDASGRLIVGATSVSGSNQVEIQTGLTNGLWVQTGQTSSSYYVADFRTGTNASVLALRADNTALVSGNLLVGTTSTQGYFDGKLNVAGRIHSKANASTQGSLYYAWTDQSSGSGTLFTFGYGSSFSLVGTISTNGTSTSYNTSSDYRLKNTITPMTGALAKVALLKPCTYKWNADGSDGEGFIAHELAEVCPDAVTGEKDAVDAEGKPVYQGIDTSFLAGLYAAALQELNAKVEALTAELNTLKGN
jgi:hypothetical protein